jgi:phage terminase small subunit
MLIMPPLANAQHEVFAQEVAKGRKIGEAYALAGFNPHPANPTRLRNNRRVTERITEIREKASKRAAERLAISKQRVLEELAKIGFANMMDYMTVGASGEPVLNWRDLTRDQAAALQEVTIDEYVVGRGDEAREVRRVKSKLAPKQPPLEQIRHRTRHVCPHVGSAPPLRDRSGQELLKSLLTSVIALCAGAPKARGLRARVTCLRGVRNAP